MPTHPLTVAGLKWCRWVRVAGLSTVLVVATW